MRSRHFARFSPVSLFALRSLLVALGLLLCGCSSGGGSGGSTPLATQSIGPGGGVLEVTNAASPYFGVRLSIPAGALPADVSFVLRGSASTAVLPLPDDRIIAVSVEPGGTTFAVPAELELPYADDGSVRVGEEALLRALVSGPNGWEEPLALERDAVANRVRIPVEHLSTFLLLPAHQFLGPMIRVHIDMTDSGLSATDASTARTTIVSALTAGPWQSKLACSGLTVSVVSDPSAADLRMTWKDFQADPGLNSSALACFCIQRQPVPTSLHGPFDLFLNNNLLAPGTWSVDSAATPAGTEFDLFSVVAHELAHGLGLPADHLVGMDLPGPGSSCPAESYSPAAVVGESIQPGTTKHSLTPFDEAFMAAAYPLSFGAVAPTGSAGLEPITLSVETMTNCGLHALDIGSVTFAVDDSGTGAPVVFSSGILADPLAPDHRSATFSLVLAPGALARGVVEVLATVADECGHERSTTWSFSVGGTVAFNETWTASAQGTYTPGTQIRGSAATWLLEDTVSEFPEDCGPTPHRAFIETGASGNGLRILSAELNNGCSDNIGVAAFVNIPLNPGTRLSFDATGTLSSPEVNGFNHHLGDRIFVGVVTSQGHVVFYTIAHADGLEPFEGPSGIFDVDKEFFVMASAGSTFSLDVFGDFAALSGFSEGARIVQLIFEVDEHGAGTLDNLRITAP